MTFFQVDRTQYPIGQGSFHATAIRRRGSKLSMVIDCGGATAAHRAVLIDEFAQGQRRHDILAISHFDQDHINGIEELHAAGVSFDSVFLPHAEIRSYLLWMTLKLSGEELADEDIANVIRIGGRLYGGDFGPVVLVGTGSPEQPGERDLGPDSTNVLRDQLTDDAFEALKRAREGGQIFSCSQSLNMRNVDWLFRFYSREWIYPEEARVIWSLPLFAGLKAVVNQANQKMTQAQWSSFASALEVELSRKVSHADAPQIRKILGAGLSKTDTRQEPLRRLAHKIRNTPGLSCKEVLTTLYSLSQSLEDYNDASMCVYSGPAQRGTDTWPEQFSRTVHQGQRALRNEKLLLAHNREVGWITTGDADFSTPEKMKEFLRHYHAETALTSVFVLPHHGSRNSYDSNMDRLRELIANLCDRPLFIAPANPEHKKFRHPHWPVESTCRKAGDFYIVDNDFASYYRETIKPVRALAEVLSWEWP